MVSIGAAEPNATLPWSSLEAKKYVEETNSGASEPAKAATHAAGNGSNPAAQRATTAFHEASDPAAASRDASELTDGAEKAAKDLANLLEDQPKRSVRRKARDGYLYTKDEFLDFYDDDTRTGGK